MKRSSLLLPSWLAWCLLLLQSRGFSAESITVTRLNTGDEFKNPLGCSAQCPSSASRLISQSCHCKCPKQNTWMQDEGECLINSGCHYTYTMAGDYIPAMTIPDKQVDDSVSPSYPLQYKGTNAPFTTGEYKITFQYLKDQPWTNPKADEINDFYFQKIGSDYILKERIQLSKIKQYNGAVINFTLSSQGQPKGCLLLKIQGSITYDSGDFPVPKVPAVNTTSHPPPTGTDKPSEGPTNQNRTSQPTSQNGTSQPTSQNGTSQPTGQNGSQNGTNQPTSQNGTSPSQPINQNGTSQPTSQNGSQNGTSHVHPSPTKNPKTNEGGGTTDKLQTSPTKNRQSSAPNNEQTSAPTLGPVGIERTDGNSNVAAIAGGAVGGTLGLALIVAAIVIFWRKRSKKENAHYLSPVKSQQKDLQHFHNPAYDVSPLKSNSPVTENRRKEILYEEIAPKEIENGRKEILYEELDTKEMPKPQRDNYEVPQ